MVFFSSRKYYYTFMNFFNNDIWSIYLGFSSLLGIYISVLTLFQSKGEKKPIIFYLDLFL